MPDFYIIGGCNGAGKTTASFTVFPEILDCREFVNADSIAAGLSPFNPESVAILAGRIMLARIHELMAEKATFAIETTLSTRSYVSLVRRAQEFGYTVTILYIWLPSPQMAIERVAQRVSKGGHNIPRDVIERRYYKGLHHFFHLFMPICDNWYLVDNAGEELQMIAFGRRNNEQVLRNSELYYEIQHSINDDRHRLG
ncbi:MAG: zeta toxin [Chitinophagia bacterium]|nr:zeta toxin [Chitinophagia bacterium]